MHNWRPVILLPGLLLIANCLLGPPLPSAQARDWSKTQAATTPQATTALASKTISQKELEKYKPVSITVDEDGKQVAYSGVPMRSIFAEMEPQIKIDSMPEWKALSRKQLVIIATGEDGYPGLVTAIELAINKNGFRFLLATHKDGQLIESGVQLICPADQAHTRWVRNVVSLQVKSTDSVAGRQE